MESAGDADPDGRKDGITDSVIAKLLAEAEPIPDYSRVSFVGGGPTLYLHCFSY